MWVRVRGSSPLARGLLRRNFSRECLPRIIPARAGFTTGELGGSLQRADHPRSRGVYSTPLSATASPRGSSPLARGLRYAPAHFRSHQGIIPARAGFTCMLSTLSPGTWDHPRSRGVYASTPLPRGTVRGSSPLARGLRVTGITAWKPRRIIPARAGFTPTRPRRRHTRRDHPRSRGVYFAHRLAEIDVTGSSPLARGLLASDHRAP